MRGPGYILPKVYRKLGFGFFALSVFALIMTSYLIWARVTIIITPSIGQLDQQLSVTVKKDSFVPGLVEENIVSGSVQAVNLEKTETFQASGEKRLTSDVVGEVTIVNNYSREQTLIRTTRLAFADDPETVIVRLNSTIVVPPGQTQTVQVYPEDQENFSELPPSRFIIPGLWGPLQEFIYAQNDAVLSKVGVRVATVTEADIARAEESLGHSLSGQVIVEVNKNLEAQQTLWPKLLSTEDETVVVNAAVGDEVSEFNATARLRTAVVVFDESALVRLVRDRLRLALSGGQELITVTPQNLSYELKEYDAAAGTATIQVTITGSSILGRASELFDTRRLLGLTEEEVKKYFAQFSEVQAVEVRFKPAWLKKTPRLAEKIEVRIAD